jgi:endonuclease/exonuclease/phosphatase family metal-dependent hydrolase
VTEGNPRRLLATALLLLGCALAGFAVWLVTAAPVGRLSAGVPTRAVTSEASGSPSSAAPTGTAKTTPPTTATSPQACTTTQPLIVMTFNIHHAAKQGTLELEQVAREIALVQPDVLALQEVDDNDHRSAYLDEAAWLGRQLDMTVLFGANRFRAGPHGTASYGNALLTSLPVLAHRNQWLPNQPGLEQRGLLLATLDLHGTHLTVGATHLQHRPEPPRVLQATYVAEVLAAEPGPRILLGDLNDEPPSTSLKILGRVLHDLWPGVGAAPGYTHPVHHPDRRIDYVLGDDAVRATQAGVVVSRVSDHRAVWSVLTVAGPCRAPKS